VECVRAGCKGEPLFWLVFRDIDREIEMCFPLCAGHMDEWSMERPTPPWVWPTVVTVARPE